MFLKCLSVVMLAAGMMAAAQAAEPVKKGAKAAAEAKPHDLICTYEKTTGSHLKRRNCVTRAEREERTRLDQDTVQRIGKHAAKPSAKPTQ